MTDFINDDPVNNITYMNYFNALTNGEINLYTGASSVNIPNACKVRWGNDAVGTLSYSSGFLGFGLIPLAPNLETKTDRIVTNNNYRLMLPYISGYFFSSTPSARYSNPPYLNSNNSTGQTIVGYAYFGGNYSQVANSYEYAIITNNFIAIAGFASNGGQLNTSNYFFSCGGWLSDSEFTGLAATRSLAILAIFNNRIISFRPSVENQTTIQNFLTTGLAQYPITCLNSGLTPSDAELWCTDLWLRDDPSGYAIGRVPHVLMTNNSVLNLGELVYIDSVIDGITDQKVWLVAANYGTRRLLMRVFTENIAYAA